MSNVKLIDVGCFDGIIKDPIYLKAMLEWINRAEVKPPEDVLGKVKDVLSNYREAIKKLEDPEFMPPLSVDAMANMLWQFLHIPTNEPESTDRKDDGELKDVERNCLNCSEIYKCNTKLGPTCLFSDGYPMWKPIEPEPTEKLIEQPKESLCDSCVNIQKNNVCGLSLNPSGKPMKECASYRNPLPEQPKPETVELTREQWETIGDFAARVTSGTDPADVYDSETIIKKALLEHALRAAEFELEQAEKALAELEGDDA
jgi:hypothetical protein